MAIEELLAVVPPPKKPLEAGDPTAWGGIEDQVGTKLPTDLREFGLRYGTGRFADIDRLFMVSNPFQRDYVQTIRQVCDLRRSSRIACNTTGPYEFFPQSPGLLPWGGDDNGYGLFWLTQGAPDEWPTVIKEPESEKYQLFNMSMSSFLTKSITREITSLWSNPAFSFSDNVVFEPTKQLHRIVLE